jgi:hypothetical protein
MFRPIPVESLKYIVLEMYRRVSGACHLYKCFAHYSHPHAAPDPGDRRS